jgi:hypothetical protein
MYEINPAQMAGALLGAFIAIAITIVMRLNRET